MAPQGRRRRLGDLLVEASLINDSQLKAALNEQRKWGGRLGRTVVELGFVTETAMGEMLAKQLDLPSVDLDTAQLPPAAPTWLRLDLCERYGVFPLDFDKSRRAIRIATSDPTNAEHIQALEFATNLKVLPSVATASAIERAIRKYYFGETLEPELVRTEPKQRPLNETSFELDSLLGAEPRHTDEQRSIKAPIAERPASAEAELRRDIAVLREKAEALEEINTSQVRSLRVLLELLIESGLVTREEYLEKLHAPE